MLEINKYTFNPFSENTYLLFDTVTRESIVIDPGNMDKEEDDILIDFIESNDLNLKNIVVTHSHIDHVIGVSILKEKFGSSFFAPEKDMPLLLHVKEQGAAFGIEINSIPEPDSFVEEGIPLKLGNWYGEFLFTPGHSPGEHCLYFKDRKVLFSGDVLFKDTIGRTDLWGGDYNTLLNSINQKIFSLPDDVIVYPGHGEETTILREKKKNPFFGAV